MKHGGKVLTCIVGGLAVCTLARGVPVDPSETSDNPYQSIIDRNVFSLKPPPPPPDPTEVNKPQVLKITLTGITTIFGDKRVLMKTAPPPGKPGEPPKTEQSYILTQGQREGDIEVIQIDEKTGSVKVNNGGTVQTLTFQKDGAKLPATMAPPASGVPGMIPGLPVPRLPGAPAAPNFQLPTRVPRLPTPGAQASGTGQTYGAPTPQNFLPGNTTSLGLSAPQQNTQTILPGGQISAEQQLIEIEANRQAGGPGAALLPPTPLTPRAGAEGRPSPPQITLPPLPGRALPPGPY